MTFRKLFSKGFILAQLLHTVMAVCGEPSTIEDGSVSGSGYNHGDTRSYSCDPGYWLYGCSLSVCKSDGTWSSSPNCGRKNCYSPPYVRDSSRSGNGTSLYDYQRYTCITGYEMDGEATIYCGVSGWDTAPQCNKVDCGNPPDVSFGTWLAPYTLYKDNATYSCDHGYDITGSSVVTCQDTKSWTTPPTCLGVNCGTPPTLTNGALQSSTGTRYPNTATYVCNNGYDMVGSDTISCQANQNWTSVSICRVRVCGSPPSIQNGNVEFEGNDYGDTANYTCNVGYELVGSSSIQCQSSASWSAAPSCTIIDCGSIPVVSGSSSLGTMTTYGSSWQYTCNPGLSMYGSNTVTCDSNGFWSTPPTCYTPCSTNPVLEHSQIAGSGTEYLDTRVFVCDIGYNLQGSATVTCQMNGQWSNLPSCIIVSCGTPPTINHGYLNGSGTEYLDTKEIVCDDGYQVNGNSITTCSGTGQWSTIEDCIRKNCGNPAAIPYSGYTISGTLFTDTALVTCDIGYNLIGADTITCQSDGSWSLPPSCERKNCGPVPHVNNTEVEGTETLYQDTVIYTCENGYIMNGSSVITCLFTGQWSGTPFCTRKTCGEIPAIANSTYTITGYNYEDIAEFTCMEDHILTWPDTLTCDENGAWSARPTCVPPISSYPTNFTFDISGSTLNETEKAALAEKVESIRNLLALNEKLLTRNIRKRISVYEENTTPMSIGIVGGALLAVVFALFVVIPDLPRIWNDIHTAVT